ncbi:hypothetical protein AKJ16_DCAP23062 [Drosera capensis]
MHRETCGSNDMCRLVLSFPVHSTALLVVLELTLFYAWWLLASWIRSSKCRKGIAELCTRRKVLVGLRLMECLCFCLVSRWPLMMWGTPPGIRICQLMEKRIFFESLELMSIEFL